MNQLSISRRCKIIHTLCEGASVRSTVRLQGVGKLTITQLIRNVGWACSAFQDATLRNLKLTQIQCDEMWSYVHTKRQNITHDRYGRGDAWLWTALDAESKLFVTWRIGPRVQPVADAFMGDIAQRIIGTLEIVTDGARHYVRAIDQIDRPMLCGHRPIIGRYLLTQTPNVTTNHVERLNLTLRTSLKRLARRSNAQSKSMTSHAAMIGMWSMFYNYCRVHQTIKTTPAVRAGLATEPWTIRKMLRAVGVDYQWKPDPNGDKSRVIDGELGEGFCECCGQVLLVHGSTWDGRFCSRYCRNTERDHAPDELEQTA